LVLGVALLLARECLAELPEGRDLNLMLIVQESRSVWARLGERLTVPEALGVQAFKSKAGDVVLEEELDTVCPVEITLPLSREVAAAEVRRRRFELA
jgi:hypothetical protein